jgi:hypothetical protein
MIAGRIECLGKFGHGRSFAAGRPPMGNFEICGICRTKRQHDGSAQRCRHQTDIHEFSSLTETLPEKLSSIDIWAQQLHPKNLIASVIFYQCLSNRSFFPHEASNTAIRLCECEPRSRY